MIKHIKCFRNTEVMEFVDVIDEEANSPKRHDKMHDIIISYLIKPHDINMLLNGISEHYITI